MTIFTDLPGDLVEEILCRVPATSLKRLRTTCKRWNHLFINDMGFARKHSDKASKESLFFMLSDERRIRPMSVHGTETTPSVEFKSELSLRDPRSSNLYQLYVDQVFHCDGLLLCFSGDDSRIVVWNPCTDQTKWIEARVCLSGCDLALGYDNKKSYKILKFDCFSKETEVYEFNSGSWRILDYDDIIAPGWSLDDYFCHGVSLNGNTYMFATGTQLHESLLRFDFSTEKFQTVTLPYQWHSEHVTALLSVVREEKLSMLLQRDFTSKTEIWVTNKIEEETRAVFWTKVLAFDLSFYYIPGSFLLVEEKKVVLRSEFREHIHKLCIVGEDNEVIQVDLGEFGIHRSRLNWSSVILNYVPSLVQMGGNKRKRDDCVPQVKPVPERKRPFCYVFFGRSKIRTALQFKQKKEKKDHKYTRF